MRRLSSHAPGRGAPPPPTLLPPSILYRSAWSRPTICAFSGKRLWGSGGPGGKAASHLTPSSGGAPPGSDTTPEEPESLPHANCKISYVGRRQPTTGSTIRSGVHPVDQYADGARGSNTTATVVVATWLPSGLQRWTVEEESGRDEHLKYNCKCSFLEIYNEQLTDLLDPSSANLQGGLEKVFLGSDFR
ncbi:hypothetical protein ZWY2020_024860 [Hordeum vulgare]|nr:hypothetical protein ZWY2020_024860 [Hordeum vulgare]